MSKTFFELSSSRFLLLTEYDKSREDWSVSHDSYFVLVCDTDEKVECRRVTRLGIAN